MLRNTKQRLIRMPQRGCALIRENARSDPMLERIAHYRELAAQFRHWAESETVPEARDGLLDMAREYERLAIELQASAATAKDEARVQPKPGSPELDGD